MKQFSTVCLLILLFLSPLCAQNREEGVAFWTEENETSGLYAAHKTFPFGTELIITNPVSKAQVNVLVGGRPRLDVPDLLVEISKEAAEKLGMPPGYPMWVYIMEAPIVRPASLPAMRPRAGTVTQTGIATVRNTNESVLEAAHPSIAIGSKVKLTNTRTGQNVIVIIRNRILASRERIVEITRGAAGALGITQRGEVRLESVTLQ